MKKHECDTCNATDASQRHNRVKKVRHEKQKVQQGQTDPWGQRSEARSPLGGGGRAPGFPCGLNWGVAQSTTWGREALGVHGLRQCVEVKAYRENLKWERAHGDRYEVGWLACCPGHLHCSLISQSSDILCFNSFLPPSLQYKTQEDKSAHRFTKISLLPRTEPAPTRHVTIFNDGTSRWASFQQSQNEPVSF